MRDKNVSRSILAAFAVLAAAFGGAAVLASGGSVDGQCPSSQASCQLRALTVRNLTATGTTTLRGPLNVDGGVTVLSSSASCLAIDGNVLKVDCANNRVGVNVTSPLDALHVVGAVRIAPSGAEALSIPAVKYLSFTGAGSYAVALQANNTDQLQFNLASAAELYMSSTSFNPIAAGGNSIGTAALPWLNLYASATVQGQIVDAGTLRVGGTANIGFADGGWLNTAGDINCAGGVYSSGGGGVDFYALTGAFQSGATSAPTATAFTFTPVSSFAGQGSVAKFNDGVADVVTINFGGLTTTGALKAGSSVTRGLIPDDGGTTHTATVLSGAICTCSPQAAATHTWCSVSGTTLTVNMSSATVTTYVCL